MKRILILAVLLTAVLSAWGQDNSHGVAGWDATGNGLLAACQGDVLGVCYAYIHGALDGMLTGQVAMHRGMTMHLPNIPDGVTNGELVKVVLAYTDKHPEELHVSASYLVYRALGEAWGFSKPRIPLNP